MPQKKLQAKVLKSAKEIAEKYERGRKSARKRLSKGEGATAGMGRRRAGKMTKRVAEKGAEKVKPPMGIKGRTMSDLLDIMDAFDSSDNKRLSAFVNAVKDWQAVEIADDEFIDALVKVLRV